MVTATGQTRGGSTEWVANTTHSLMELVTQTLPPDVIDAHDTDWIPNLLSQTTVATNSFTAFGTNVTGASNSTQVLTTEETNIVTGATILSLIMMISTCFLIIFGNLIVLIVFHYTPASAQCFWNFHKITSMCRSWCRNMLLFLDTLLVCPEVAVSQL